MSENPKSVNYTNPELAHEGRAAARQHAIEGALKATTGQAGLDEGNRHKTHIKRVK